jgi:hypothetical protein
MRRVHVFSVFLMLLLVGCASNKPSDYSAAGPSSRANTGQLIIRRASIDLSVKGTAQAASQITTTVARYSGYVVSTSAQDEKYTRFVVKVPSDKLDAFVADIAIVGEVTSKSVSARDVTEEVIDIDAKLKNLRVLRERYRALLAQTKNITEILEIEKELNRLQTDIDTIAGKQKALKNDAELVEVHIDLREKTIYGPLGYLCVGVFWVVEKLFVIK